MSDPKAKRLRAILRAPEVIQELYREGCMSQVDAARLGPKSPTPERAEKVAAAVHLTTKKLVRRTDKFRAARRAAVARQGRTRPAPRRRRPPRRFAR